MNLDLQKASMWKRMSASLFDIILLSVIIVVFAFLLSTALGYDGYNTTLNNAYEKYETQFGMTFDITQEEFEAMTAADIANYEAAYAALIADEEAMFAYNMVLYLSIAITSISVLLAFAAYEFAVPLYLGNGQTLGKKIFSIAVMRVDFVRIPPVQLFIRSILGKYTIETMLPILILLLLFFGKIGIVGTAILFCLLAGQIASMVITDTNSALHDLLAGTVTVDISSQMIFEDSTALLEYQKKVAAEKAARQEY